MSDRAPPPSTEPRDADPHTTPEGLLRIATAPLALPIGLRDLLPPYASQRRALARAVLAHFERYGYELVVPPAFEREDVVGLGLSAGAKRDLVRFLEPDTGEVVVLRPDVTPQIARITATRYRDARGPLRFMYEGSVVRRPRGRARRHRQIAQAGIECIGWPGVSADAEVIRATIGALDELGLRETRVELAHAGIAAELLRGVPAARVELATEALSARDVAALAKILGEESPAFRAIERALALAGGASVLDEAAQVLEGEPYVRALGELRAAYEALCDAGLGHRVLFDLGAVRGLGYYTGVAFVLLAPGPGEPVGGGGRYDGLLARYGSEGVSTGAALDLELVAVALEHAGLASKRSDTSKRVLVCGADARARAREAERLRNTGLHVAECDAVPSDEGGARLGRGALARYDAVLSVEGETLRALDAQGTWAPLDEAAQR